MAEHVVKNLGAKRAAAKQAYRVRLDRKIAGGADGVSLNGQVGLVSPDRKPARPPKRLGRGPLKQTTRA